MADTHGIHFDGTGFWVRHRRREFGPFDYDWSNDLHGIELTYRGEKFGEYCGQAEVFADLKPYQLPRRVVEVAIVTLGCLIVGVLGGWTEQERRTFLHDQLRCRGLSQFIPHESR